MERQVKSKRRVADHGEVFTAEREVKAMCDLVSDECRRIDSRFLEPACGEGNFLAEILSRKLARVRELYGKNPDDYERNAILALSSIYGVDILSDNAQACRDRLFALWDGEYAAACGEKANGEARAAARFILSLNIVCGNALTMKCVDARQRDTDEPIKFPEWTFPTNKSLIKRRDFRLDVLLLANETAQMSMFTRGAADAENWRIDPETNAPAPQAVGDYDAIDYRRLGDNG